MRNVLFAIAALLLVFISIITDGQTVFPTGFSEVLVAGGITSATTMAQAPDGRFFIAQQNGVLKVVKNDTMLNKPFISLSVNTNGERGLLGIAFDPSFNTNQYIYLCYTIANGSFNRVSRFTASGDTVVPGSEVVIIELDSLIANYHGGGHLDFGPDGKLYIAAGENGRPLKAQDLDSYLGKILRVNPDGSTPAFNPFPGPGKRRNVWAYGLRNPYTFSFQPGTGLFYVNDVGDTTYEEINDATIGGGNFGWPQEEGYSTDTALESPVYVYNHGTGPGLGCAITGGAFFNPDTTNFPSNYLNNYFYIDYCGNWIDMITMTNPPVRSNFASNIPNYPVCILTGHDGNLYYLSRNNEALYKIVYSPNPAPVVVSDPQDQTVSVNYPATFSVTASGNVPLSYQWRKGTTNIPGATGAVYTIPNVAFSDSGDYNVIVTNSFGSDTSNNGHLTVTPNQPPQATIDTPLVGSTYAAGEIISFHGSATDPEDGAIPDSLLEWVVVFHHNSHVHPGPLAPSGVSSGQFTIPDIGETSPNVFYRLYLIVHDQDGAVDSSYVDIFPRTTSFTLNSFPQGLNVSIDGTPFLTPYTVLGVEGMIRTISAPYTIPGTPTLYFTSWSNGGTLVQSITTPVNDTDYTANYDTLSMQLDLGNDTMICEDDSLYPAAGLTYLSYAWSDGSVDPNFFISSAIEDTFMIALTVTDSAGNTGHDTLNVIVQLCTGVAENESMASVIYPIPSTGELKISPAKNDYLIAVTDLSGRQIVSNRLVKANEEKSLLLPQGVYVVQFYSTTMELLKNQRVIITR